MIRKSRKPVKRRKVSTKVVQVRTMGVEKILIENFVSLQKVMTNLSMKFDNLASQISKLLELFEMSAKSLAHKDFGLEKEDKDSKEVIAKLDNLLGQNKIIAKGLTLMHEANFPKPNKPQQPKNLTEQRQDRDMQQQSSEVSGYQKSMSSNQKDALPKP
ncbi:MAG: hypothetical protein IIA85_00845 [Nanoarchaeota archaeon]|nr:hypothetical protein [Nanoarchaeota archaeon]